MDVDSCGNEFSSAVQYCAVLCRTCSIAHCQRVCSQKDRSFHISCAMRVLFRYSLFPAPLSASRSSSPTSSLWESQSASLSLALSLVDAKYFPSTIAPSSMSTSPSSVLSTGCGSGGCRRSLGGIEVDERHCKGGIASITVGGTFAEKILFLLVCGS
jgi:hypothetical protein